VSENNRVAQFRNAYLAQPLPSSDGAIGNAIRQCIDELNQRTTDPNGQATTVGRLDGISQSDCANGTESIYFPGDDQAQIASHDAAAIASTPALAQLHYAKTAEKSDDPTYHRSWANQYQCVGQSGGQRCDEYPFYSTDEGYPVANPPFLKLVPAEQNAKQGTTLLAFYRTCPTLQNSDRGSPNRAFLVAPVIGVNTFGVCGSGNE
jgi:hypothetical protein